jgi:putative membrane protein
VFVDYLTLMLLNMVVGLVLFSLFMWRFIEKSPKKLVPGFLLTGFIALATGLPMTLTWPLPQAYNIPYGELTVALGGLLFVTGISLIAGWDLLSIGIYAFFVGAASIVLAIRFLALNLTNEPVVAFLGLLLTGATAILALPALAMPKQKWLRWLVALAALASAVIWAIVVFPAYWQHMEDFAKYAPGGAK